MTEYWKDVVGYEGLYQVSNLGNVRSIDRWELSRSKYRFRQGCLLKKYMNRYGYYVVNLYKNANGTPTPIHRIVAMAFLPNPFNLPCVNHKDENKTNNAVINLEWCTYKYNCNYGTGIQRCAMARVNGKMSKKVLQYNTDGTLVKEWVSLSEVQRSLGYAKQNVSASCKGTNKTAYGYIWRYAS